mmetsp:Transcript_69977/g.189109  ORF Transcript_69977/g.189109 Transcript_69977/m.189109 type:complete len:231 (-) Transcript_69977:65-757(-)
MLQKGRAYGVRARTLGRSAEPAPQPECRPQKADRRSTVPPSWSSRRSSSSSLSGLLEPPAGEENSNVARGKGGPGPTGPLARPRAPGGPRSVPRRLGEPADLEVGEHALGAPALGALAIGQVLGGAHAHLRPGGEGGGRLVVLHLPAGPVGRPARLPDLLPARLPARLVEEGAPPGGVEPVPVALALGRDGLQGLGVRVEPEQATDVGATERAQAPHGQVQMLLPGQVLT